MLRIAVTGGIACGQSLVGSLLAAEGVDVCDADDLARGLMRPGNPVYAAVATAFGPSVLADDGAIDRGRLGSLVFADGALLARLNALVHPAVREAWEAWLAERESQAAAAAVIVPLLYEAGAGAGWSAVICVNALPAVQRERLLARGLGPEAAALRVAAQWPLREKLARADYVLTNNGTKELLKRQTLRVLRRILET